MSGFTLEAEFIGTLAKVLTDLQGYTTLANELIQNADDAAGDLTHPGATQMSFDIRDDAVVVSNDSVFSFCGAMGRECGHDQRCDVHAFLRVASETKRGRDDTTGAFGIGFTAVYQITDRPELLSAGLHLTLHPEAPDPKDRVEVCSGCVDCAETSGTVFRLPWATEGSALRRALGQEARRDPDGMAEELRGSLRDSLPFLRRVKRIELARSGRAVATFSCERDSERVRLLGPDAEVVEFHRLAGDFDDDAAALREQPDAPIEDKRASEVEVLVGTDLAHGQLYAVLPTEQQLAATMLVSADFFPHSSRRTINLETGLRSEWNRAAVRAAGRILADHLGELPDKIGDAATWRLVASVHRTANEASDACFASLWEPVREAIESAEIAPATDGSHHLLSDLLFVPAHDDDVALDVLVALGARVLSPDVRDWVRPLPRGDFGMRELSPGTLASLLVEGDVASLSQTDLDELWGLMDRLLARVPGPAAKTAEDQLAATATAPGLDGELRPWTSVQRADPGSSAVLQPYLHLLDEQRLGARKRIDALSRFVRVADVIDALGNADAFKDPVSLCRWFHARKEELRQDDDLRDRVRGLPIFPSHREGGRAFLPLDELALTESKAGAFADEAGIAAVLDVSVGDDVVQLARFLEIPRLTLREYVERQIPLALDLAGEGVPDWIGELLRMLARHRDEIAADMGLSSGLRGLTFVPCGERCLKPEEALFSSAETKTVMGADWPTYSGPIEAMQLLAALGVSHIPQPRHILGRVVELIEEPPTDDSVAMIREVLALLAIHHAGDSGVRVSTVTNRLREHYPDLFTAEWLPARNDRSRWYSPDEIFRSQRARLFESQATFLDVPIPVQNQAVDVLRAFGVEVEPSVAMVVAHLRHCSKTGAMAYGEIYRKLEDEVNDQAVHELTDNPSHRLGDGRWVRPDEAFWDEHGLGPLATRLDPEHWNSWRRLLDEIGVRSQPDHRDALRVLKEIAEADLEPSIVESVVDHCWQLVDAALGIGAVEPSKVKAALGPRLCVPAADGTLLRPSDVYADDRPQLADRLRKELGPTLITRPTAAWEAMRTAGVKPISEHLLGTPRYDSTSEHRILKRLFGDRREQVARLLESALGSGGVLTALDQIDTLDIRAATKLSVTWQFTLDPRVRIDVADVGAVWVVSQGALYVNGELDGGTWIDITRELAFALEADPSHLAVLRSIFEAESGEEADDFLDRLSIPRLSNPIPISASELAGHGVDDATEPDDGPAPAADEDPPFEEERSKEAAAGDGGGAGESEAPGEDTEEEPVDGDGQTSDTTPGKSGTGTDARRRKRAKDVDPSEWWRVIVSGRSKGATDPDGAQSAHLTARRSAIDRAGVDAVLAHETGAGRNPVEMPHDNPGYDVESMDDDGQLARYIEVKSLAGEWGPGNWPALSPRQLEFARVNGEQTWLYVVEFAETSPQITRINDPVGTATKFVFDPGWAVLGEASADVESFERIAEAVVEAGLAAPQDRYLPDDDPDVVLDLAWPEQRLAIAADPPQGADLKGWRIWKLGEIGIDELCAALRTTPDEE